MGSRGYDGLGGAAAEALRRLEVAVRRRSFSELRGSVVLGF